MIGLFEAVGLDAYRLGNNGSPRGHQAGFSPRTVVR